MNLNFPISILTLVFLSTLGACDQNNDLEYFPLNQGAIWQYQIISHDMDVTKKYKYLIVNGSQHELDGVKAFTRRINDGILYFYQSSDKGIRRIGRQRILDINTQYEKEDHYVLKYPLAIGTQWQQQTITGVLEVVIAPFRRHYALHAPVQMQYTISSLDELVKVPAGQFEHCIKVSGLGTTHVEADKSIGIVDVTVESSDWYCPNVGLVKSRRDEKTSSTVLVKGDFLMELENFSEG